MTFDEFIAPVGAPRFAAEYQDRRPLHLAGGAERLRFPWARMNDLLGIASHWTPGNVQLILNSRAVEPQHYMDPVDTLDGRVMRADPAKVAMFTGLGASLVANGVEAIAPEIAAVCDMLARRFAGLASANIYCSFDAVQAFATHCDSHEVFAVQCEGEKRWRLYEGRADAPLGDGGMSQAQIDAARGRVAQEVLMRPGDLLYIPRGVYHDAIARAGASLHVTLSVAPRPGLAIAPLLEAAMARDPAFRAYLPPAEEAGGGPFLQALAGLADRLAALVRSPQFAIEVADLQRRAAAPRVRATLPQRPAGAHYARTDRPVELRRTPQGVALTGGGRVHNLGPTFAAAEWALSRPAFGEVELAARFGHVAEPARRQLVELLLREGLVERYDPSV